MKAEIISIGDEILIGQITNTNAAWMGEELTGIGVEVIRNTVVADRREDILTALEEAEQRADLVIITGGIGPTKDDITKTTLAEYFGSKLVHSEEVLDRIRELFKGRVNMNELNRAQAMLPDNCTTIPNYNGTASGMRFSKNETEYISLPGVPYEMKAMMSDYILPMLAEEFDLPAIVHKTMLIQGVPESHLAKLLEEYEDSIPTGVKLAYLPSPGRVRLRLTSSGKDRRAVEDLVNQEMQRLIPFIPQGKLYGYGEEELEKLVGQLLKDNNATLALAESCTGGTIASLITSVPGSSEYFIGGVVAYSNEIKQEVLGVDSKSIEKHGAVSREVVEQMAEGVRKRFGADYSIATSGIAGPDGGTDKKPVGTTWIAVASEGITESEVYRMGDHRGRNIRKASVTGLNMLRNLVINTK
ncbi:MAG TPA: competence/damage-inducible protein A [Bacteroides sp.]|nr:competence/damage-inducible protein A [Bacteroides sp.]